MTSKIGSCPEIHLPLSKSIVNRILVIEFVSGRNPAGIYSFLEPSLLCRDIVDLERGLEAIWSQIHGDNLEENPGNSPLTVNISEGAAPLRFFIATAASTPDVNVEIPVIGRLAERPLDSLLRALVSMGADIEKRLIPQGFCLHINGKRLKVSELSLETSQTSQFLSALMLVSPNIEGWENINVPESVVSSPYVYMTQRLLEERNHDLLKYLDADWSASANFFVSALFSPVSPVLMGLKQESLQGDAFIATLFRSLGGEIKHSEKGIEIFYPKDNRGEMNITVPLGETPDIVPPLAVGLAIAGIRYRFMGIAHLRHKESDRIAVLMSEMRKIGYVLRYAFGSLVWEGERISPLHDPVIDPHQDHRIAMAFAPAEKLGLCTISDREVVDKSYPSFWGDYEELGIRSGIK